MKNPTSFRLSDDALKAIRELAQLHGGSQSEAVEYLAREWKKEHAAEVMAVRVKNLEEQVATQAELIESLCRDLENKVSKPTDW